MRTRIVTSVVLAVSLLFVTTGCSFFAVNSTLKPYDPSDGVGAVVGQVKVRNAMLLSTDGQLASFVVNFINDGSTPVTMVVQYTSKSNTGVSSKISSKIDLAAGEVRTFGAADTPQMLFQNIDTKVGALMPVFVQYGNQTGTELMVPVLNGALTEYSTLLPSPLPTATPPVGPTVIPIPTGTPLTPSTQSSATPTASATPTVSATPTPSATPTASTK